MVDDFSRGLLAISTLLYSIHQSSNNFLAPQSRIVSHGYSSWLNRNMLPRRDPLRHS